MAEVLSNHCERDKKRRKDVCSRGGSILQEPAESLQYLFPLTSSQLFTYLQWKESTVFENEQCLHLYDFKLSDAEFTSEIIDTSSRSYTIVFQL